MATLNFREEAPECESVYNYNGPRTLVRWPHWSLHFDKWNPGDHVSMAAADYPATDSHLKNRKDEIKRLAESVRKAKELAASISPDRVTSSLMLDEADYAAMHIAADLVYLEQRLAQLTYGGLKNSVGDSEQPNDDD